MTPSALVTRTLLGSASRTSRPMRAQRGVGGVGDRRAPAGIDVGTHRLDEIHDQRAENADQRDGDRQLDQRHAAAAAEKPGNVAPVHGGSVVGA